MTQKKMALPVLVTGGAGFIGSNLVDRLAGLGHRVLVLDTLARPGVERNALWLQQRHGGRIEFLAEDVRDEEAVERAVGEACAVFHFAAQVAVTRSLEDPREDFAVNMAGTMNVLEAVRRREVPVPLVFASTNKVYGSLDDLPLRRTEEGYRPLDDEAARHGIGESRPLDFHTPYGCSKGAADQYVLDYCRSFGVPAAVMRMSCIYGPRQRGTEDQGWVAHFVARMLAGEPITIYGDGNQVRDLLYVDDAVDAYLRAWRALGRGGGMAGHVFNLGGGVNNAVSLLQVIDHLETILGCRARTEFEDWRAGDQRYFVSDSRRIARLLALPAPLPWRIGLSRLADWMAGETRAAREPLLQRMEA